MRERNAGVSDLTQSETSVDEGACGELFRAPSRLSDLSGTHKTLTLCHTHTRTRGVGGKGVSAGGEEQPGRLPLGGGRTDVSHSLTLTKKNEAEEERS